MFNLLQGLSRKQEVWTAVRWGLIVLLLAIVSVNSYWAVTITLLLLAVTAEAAIIHMLSIINIFDESLLELGRCIADDAKQVVDEHKARVLKEDQCAMYRPLPEGLRVQKSEIEGYGLFTALFLKQGTNLGVSHIKLEDELIRTPLGGFINHSDNPNCEKVKLRDKGYIKYNLVTLSDIKEKEELTVKYTFYNISE